MKKNIVLFSIVILLAIPIFSNADDNKKKHLTAFDVFALYLKDKEYHQAFLVLDEMLVEMKTVAEGASANEYGRLLGMTAGTGQKDWEKIFRDHRISLEYKLDLVKEIHTNVMMGAD